jgi:DegV family protein with EDD domain
MKIVIDSGADLTPEFLQENDITQVPLKVTLEEKTYLSGVNLQPEEFYNLIDKTEALPITSTPSVGEFRQVYETIAKQDPDIISIHISSGLSGTFSTAKTAAEMVKGANIAVVDSLNLSAGYGWQVEAVARAIRAGWDKQRILETLKSIRSQITALFTLPDLKYLIAGGRIGHLPGLLASILGIKPIITINKDDGKYYDCKKKRSFIKAVETIPEIMLESVPKGSKLRAQICHAGNAEGSNLLVDAVEKFFNCEWIPSSSIGPALGAHTGRGMIGVYFAPLQTYPQLP